MRILLVGDAPIDGGHEVGGVQRATRVLGDALGGLGHEVLVAAPGDDNQTGAWGTMSVVMGRSSSRLNTLSGWRRWRTSLACIAERVHPDVIQAQGASGHGFAVARLDERYPRVLAAHGSPIRDLVDNSTGPHAAARVRLLRWRVEQAVRGVDVVTNVVRDWRINLPVKPCRLVYIPNPIDVMGRPDWRVVPVENAVVWIGDSRKIKGLDLILAAWPLVHARNPRLMLDVIGLNEDDIRPLQHLVSGLGHSIRFVGRLSSHEVRARLAARPIVALTSRFEVAPLVLLEAFAAACPVVATSVGGLPESADGGALLCCARPTGIAEAIVRVAADPTLQERLAERGRTTADQHEVRSVALQYEAVYESLSTAIRGIG